MKYVLMYTSRPDLAAGADPEAAQAIYKRVYEWFGENAGVMADSGRRAARGRDRHDRARTGPTARSSSTARSTRPRR